MYALYFKSEPKRDWLRFSEEVTFQRKSDAASNLPITWENVMWLHNLIFWMCSAHFPIGRMVLMLLAECTFFFLLLLLFLLNCLLAYLVFAFSLSWKCNCRANEQVTNFTNKPLFSFIVCLCGSTFLFLYLNLMKFSKGPWVFKENVKNVCFPPDLWNLP